MLQHTVSLTFSYFLMMILFSHIIISLIISVLFLIIEVILFMQVPYKIYSNFFVC